MKKLMLVIIFLGQLILLSQTDTTFVSLQGFKDKTGNTQLLLGTKQTTLNLDVDSTIFCYNVYNTATNQQNIIVQGFEKIYFPEEHLQFSRIENIKFIEYDPQKYIYTVNSLGIDPSSSIVRFDVGVTTSYLGFIDQLYQSPNNNLYGVLDRLIIRSFDGGLTWNDFYIPPSSFPLFYNLAFSPFDESQAFGIIQENHLLKSLDTGKIFYEVDSQLEWNNDTKLFFDKDQKHIYAVTNYYEYGEHYSNVYSIFSVSDSIGEKGSWSSEIKYNKIEMCIDDSVSGKIFVSIGNEIFRSDNYGKTFSQYANLPHHANGLYAEPNKDILYATIPNGLLKITPNNIEYLTRKSVEKSLELYPIAVGNKWVYNDIGTSYDITANPFNYYYSEEITKDTICNDFNYYYLKSQPYGNSYWLRIDSLTGLVLMKYSLEDNQEYILYNLNGQFGDETQTEQGITYNCIDSSTLLWDMKRYLKIFQLQSLYTYEMSFVQGIGIIKKLNEFDFGTSTTTLKGCVVNGITYGDTNVVGVEIENNILPTEFSLSQNYPNPFNPTTTIEYTIPSNEKRWTKNVKIVVCDVLGKEVTTLVNKSQFPGKHQIVFDASNLSSGIYYYSLRINNHIISKKMIFLK